MLRTFSLRLCDHKATTGKNNTYVLNKGSTAIIYAKSIRDTLSEVINFPKQIFYTINKW